MENKGGSYPLLPDPITSYHETTILLCFETRGKILNILYVHVYTPMRVTAATASTNDEDDYDEAMMHQLYPTTIHRTLNYILRLDCLLAHLLGG